MRPFRLRILARAGLALGALFSPCATSAAQAAPDAPTVARVPRDRPWVGTRYDLDAVSNLEAWQELSVEFARPVGDAMLIVRGRGARRFGLNGTQVEGEAYPRLGARTYLYLGAATSPSDGVFPRARFAGEVYRALPRGWEASAGGRFVRAADTDVATYTGTVARYVGDYWISARPSLSTYGGQRARAVAGVARRYYSGRYDYLSLSASASAGADPEARDPQRLSRSSELHGWAVRLERLRPVGANARVRYGAGFEREEFAPGVRRTHRALVLGMDWVMP